MEFNSSDPNGALEKIEIPQKNRVPRLGHSEAIYPAFNVKDESCVTF
jgi:hypothetical protein